MTKYIEYDGIPKNVRFRHYADKEDLRGIVDVFNRCKEADGIDGTMSLEDLEKRWSRLQNCDLGEDVLMVESEGNIVGYGRHSWAKETSGITRYWFMTQLVPELRHSGIREAMVRYLEGHIIKQSETHPDGEKVFETDFMETETHARGICEALGYKIVRYGAEMIRPDLENIPELELPEDVELRPVLPEHYRQIFDTHINAFRDSWGFAEMDWDKVYENFINGKAFQPQLWQIAWHGDDVVGQVKPYIIKEENEEYNRKRGYVEFISTAEPWRGRGIASALIAKALQRVKEEGMTEAALGVDTENIHGAMKLYEKMGFRKHRLGMVCRKPVTVKQ